MSTSHVMIRVFVEASPQQAEVLARELVRMTGEQANELQCQAYYKFEGWQEISFWVTRENLAPNPAIQAIAKLLGTGWDLTLGDSDEDFGAQAIWNPGPSAKFCFDTARFAVLTVFSDLQLDPEMNQFGEEGPADL